MLRFVHLILVFFNGNSLLLFIRKFIRSLLESLKIQLTAVLIMVRIVISFSSISTFFTLYSYIHGVKYRKENLLNISRLLWQENELTRREHSLFFWFEASICQTHSLIISFPRMFALAKFEAVHIHKLISYKKAVDTVTRFLLSYNGRFINF